MKYESELLYEIIENRGHQNSSIHYESECKEAFIKETEGAYPKLCDYEAEWLNYIVENKVGYFPYETLTDITEATVDDVVPYSYRSAILKGQTLVNLLKSNHNVTVNANGKWVTNYTEVINESMIKPSTTYTLITYVHNNTIADGNGYIVGVGGGNQGDFLFTGNQVISPKQTGVFKKLLTTKSDTTLKYTLQQVMYNTSTQGTITFSQVLLEGDYTNVDIPYFTGMQSVKMPVLKTTGKNLFNCTNVEDISNSYTVVNMNSQNYITTDTLVEKGKQYTLSLHVNISGATGNILYLGYMNYSNIVGGVEKASHSILTIDDVVDKTTSITFTAQTTDYIKLYIATGKSGYNVVLSNVQIEEGSVATSYEPHKTNILSTPSDLVIRGIGTGSNRVEDKLNCLTGEVTQRIGEYQITGEENWVFVPSRRRLQIQNPTFIPNIKRGVFACDKLQAKQSYDESLHSTNGTYYIGYTSDNWLRIILGEDLTSLEQGKEWLKANKPTIQYQLKTESIKTVDLTCVNQDGENVKIKPIEGTMHITTDGTPIKPTFTGEIPVEAITQNLMSFIEV